MIDCTGLSSLIAEWRCDGGTNQGIFFQEVEFFPLSSDDSLLSFFCYLPEAPPELATFFLLLRSEGACTPFIGYREA